MKVLHLNTFDEWGGAAKAAFRINSGLRGMGVDSQMLVQTKSGNGEYVIAKRTHLSRLAYGIRAYIDTIPARLYPKRPVYNFTPAMMPDFLSRKVSSLAPDIVHLHWTAAGFMRLETVGRLKRPIVWTLHDSWAFTGGCHIPYECRRYREKCGRCPVLGSTREGDLSRRVWSRKMRSWKGGDLTIVTPSRWLAEEVRSSSLFRNQRVEVIPNGLDLTLFKPVEKEFARKQLGLTTRKKIILFGAVNITSDPNKGFHLLLEAMQRLSAERIGERVELLVFGADRPVEPPPFQIDVHYLGRVNDDRLMALIYAAADLFLVPSIMENLPNTIMEAMACGTPCVAFDQGGIPELVDHRSNGYLARPYEAEDLAYGISWVLEDEERLNALSRQARDRVEREFGLEGIAKRYHSLYREITKRGE